MKRDFILNRIIKVMLLVLSMTVGQNAWAEDLWTVTNPTGSTFRITRPDSHVGTTETVKYRTVSLSAIAGMHFTEKVGELTFDATHNSREVEVTENTPGTDAYKYQTASSREYRFEVTDLGGTYLAHCNRSITSGLTQFSGAKVSSSVSNLVTMSSSGNFSSGMSSGKYLDVSGTLPTVESSGVLKGYVLIDDEYDYAQKPATVSTSSLISSTGATAAYLNSLDYKIYATVCFTAQERDDGYQYIQILSGTSSSSYDGADPEKGVNDPSNSLYKVCYELSDGSDQGQGKAYFPHRGTGTGEFSLSDGKLWAQKYKSGTSGDGTGCIILAPTVTNITTRFDAGGKNDDTWGYKDFFVRMAFCDATAPAISGDPVVSPGPYGAGTTVYISVPFSEIVTVSGTPYIHTDWGDYNYFSGSGSNVLTFSGTIPATFGASLITRNLSGTIKDLAGNALSGTSCYKYFSSITVALPWGGSGTQADPYVISTANQLNFMATRVNATYGADNFSGKYFVLAADITYSHTTAWDTYSWASSTTENNFTPIGIYGRSFQGHFDGQGHTISGIRVYKPYTAIDTDNTNESLGLFGFVSGGSVSNVVLRDANIRGLKNMGGIVGNLSGGSVTGCTLYQVLVGSHAIANQATGMGIVIGYGGGTVTDCYYRDCVMGLTYQGHNDNTVAPHPERWDNVYAVTTATGVSATYESGTTVTIDDATYYTEGCTFTLAYSGTLQSGSVQDGYTNTYTTTNHHDHITDATLTVPAGDCSVSVRWTSAWTGSGTSEAPYLITTTDELDLLAKMVNGQGGYGYSDFSGTYFKLAGDIAYTHTTDWNDASSTENNYTAIGSWRSGTTYNQFKGSFDGDGHTISGIRIYKPESSTGNGYQGLFGYVGTGGSIHDVNLADARITGQLSVAGIAGLSYGTVTNCTVAADVLVASKHAGSHYHAGIVGNNHGTVSGCTSAVTLTAAYTGPYDYGAVVGINYSDGTVENCLALGATIPAMQDCYGVIVGYNSSGTLTANYYRDCTVGTTANAVGVGAGKSGGAPTDVDGARSVHNLTCGSGVTATPGTVESVTISGVTYYASGSTFTLAYTGTPATGHRFTGFNATAGTVSGDPTNGYTFAMAAADAIVNARIEEVAYIITYDLDGGELSGEYRTGYSVTTPTFALPTPTRTGYTFAGWTGTDLAEPTLTVIVSQGSTGDRSYTAHWTAIDYTVYPYGGWDGWAFEHGTVTPDKITGVHYGDVVTLAVTQEVGYLLKTLTVTNRTTGEATDITADENGRYAFTMPASNVDVYAEFAEALTVVIDVNIEHGTVTASPTVAYEGQTVTLTVTPDPGYELVWLTYGDYEWDPDWEPLRLSFEMPVATYFLVEAEFRMTWARLNNAMQNGGTFTLTNNVTAADGDGPLSVPEGKTVTLDLNGHTLNRNLTAATASGSVIEVNGTLTLNDGSASGTGTITGGNSTNSAGGVDVDGGTFTMNGGTISNNTAGSGGGVYLYSGTFTMNGGSISNNDASFGGGVYVNLSSTFTMNGGSISNNDASFGGVAVDGTFNVSGNPVITGNTKMNSNANNVYLKNGKVITVTGALTNAAHISVTTKTAPTPSDPVTFTSGLSGNGTVANFTSDNGSNIALINGEAALLATHTVTFLCGNGSGTMETAHIPANTDYTIPACGFTAPEGMMFVGWVSNNGWTLSSGEELYMNVDYTLTAVFHTYHTVTITGDGANGVETEWLWEDASHNYFSVSGEGSGIRFPEGASLDFHGLPLFISSTPALNFDESGMYYELDNVTTDVSISLMAGYAINLNGSGYEIGLHAYARSVADDRYIVTSAPAGAVVYIIGTMDGGAGAVQSCTATGHTSGTSYDVSVEDFGWAALGFGFTMPDEAVDANLVIGNPYEVYIDPDIEHGSVSKPGNSILVGTNAEGLYFAGDEVTLTVTPDLGYELATLTVTYQDYYYETHTVTTTQGTGANANQYTFTIPNERVDVNATFTWINPMELRDNADNTALIAAANGMTGLNVTIQGRTFKGGKKQTICLPFDPSHLLTLGTVWAFTGISEGKIVMTEQTGTLAANTPYIFQATNDASNVEFSNVTIVNSDDPKTVNNEVGFTFRGTYTQKTWEADDAAVTGGHLYGFMMQDNDGQVEGQFVKARRKTILRPFSCYLEYNGDLSDTNPSSHAAARSATRGTTGETPDVIDIVWVSANGTVTGISRLDTRTGEITDSDDWYLMDGRKLNGKPTVKGLYINNGKVVIIK